MNNAENGSAQSVQHFPLHAMLQLATTNHRMYDLENSALRIFLFHGEIL